MQSVKILIVEDELIIAESIKTILESLGYEVPAIYQSGLELIQNYTIGCADMIIMDVNLENSIDGIETSKIIGRLSSIPIIFLTDNKEADIRKKAIAETNATYYLNKPFNLGNICSAIELTLKFLKKEAFKKENDSDDSYLLDDSIFLKDGFSFKKIKLSEIILFKADGSYCHLQCKDKSFTFSENLSFFNDKLLFAKELIRVHRSYIINVNYIEKIHESRIWIGGQEVPIGKTYKLDFLKKFRLI